MREYKMRRGEHLDDRMPDLKGSVEEHFGAITGTEEFEGHELYVVGDPNNPVFERIVVGAAEYGSKKRQAGGPLRGAGRGGSHRRGERRRGRRRRRREKRVPAGGDRPRREVETRVAETRGRRRRARLLTAARRVRSD